MEEQIEELTLLLMFLTSWQENMGNKQNPLIVNRTWKGYDFDIINTLVEKDEIRGSVRSKSVILTPQGMNRARALKKKYLA
ncbi:transposase [candidate division WOR-3 bacterium]|nr:transposase [candidate division WOR-3 bacterium]